MSDKPKPATGEWTALQFFRIVHGKGDVGSEFEFHAQNPELKKGWVRLAVYTSLELAKQIAAEQESREKTELACEQWIRQCEELQQQLAAEREKWIGHGGAVAGAAVDEIQQLRQQLAAEKRMG
jgi:hypothetical protein